ncbi:site-specific integrase [uncultured Sphingobium sp.]|uniref:tyrosine-type recombinase/integrase n=1 Tax=uncultured Sphingobium sp. TaxID=316087 RepID=UPI002588C543|nr:site-specific integrase [uncultured Sphingobium sp.]
MGKLSATAVKAAKKPGRYGDGDGLFLLVSKGGSKSWMVRVQKNGQRRDFGLGSAAKTSLANAREKASVVRSQVEAGLDPVAEKVKSAGIPNVREAAKEVHRERESGWRNAKHRAQWLSTLETYAFPLIGDMSVADVTSASIRDVLIPIWSSKPETARRIRQRLATIVDWAVAKGYRESPLAMTVVNKTLPRQKRSDNHHAAMPFVDVPAFITSLRERVSVGRLALELLIFTAARSGEIRGATWREIDLPKGLWTVPADRMKAGREHIVPLSKDALSALERVQRWRREHDNPDELIFPGMKKERPLSDMTLLKIMRTSGLKATPHGFRSSFKEWASETTDFPNELSEAALAHAIPNKTEAAYRRSTMIEKRRAMMAAWGDHCDGRALPGALEVGE